LPSQYSTIAGFVFLAVRVTLGIRSTVAALFAGLSFTVFPAVAQVYLPHWFAQLPPVFFGLGAIVVAKYPDGILTTQARQVRALLLRLPKRNAAALSPVRVDSTPTVQP
jgi:branched-chain amino acid transport system permease protein